MTIKMMMMMMSKMPIMPRKDDQEVNIIIVELMTAMVIIDLHIDMTIMMMVIRVDMDT